MFMICSLNKKGNDNETPRKRRKLSPRLRGRRHNLQHFADMVAHGSYNEWRGTQTALEVSLYFSFEDK